DVQLVPDTCHVVGATALKQYLGGTPQNIQPYSLHAQSQCTYTVDAKPVFRILNLTAQAYSPNQTVPGNGSATATATYNFDRQRTLLAKPPKKTQLPHATITSLSGLGVPAFTAVQVYRLQSVSDRVTVIARYRNVLISVYLSGQTSDGFGPVSVSGLRADAIAVTRALLGEVKQVPTVS